MQLKLKSKILIIIGAVILLIIASSYIGYMQTSRVERLNKELIEYFAKFDELAIVSRFNELARIKDITIEALGLINQLQYSDSDNFSRTRTASLLKYKELTDLWKNWVPVIKGTKEIADKIDFEIENLDTLYKELDSIKAPFNSKRALGIVRDIETRLLTITSHFSTIRTLQVSTLGENLDYYIPTIPEVRHTYAVFLLAGLVLAVVMAVFFTSAIIKPIKRLSQTAIKIGKGEYNLKLEERVSDEFGELGQSFNMMVNNLLEARKEIHRKNLELEAANEELQAANEELESTNEELQATNEELEATNEELRATMEELNQSKNEVMELNVNLQKKVEERTIDLKLTNEQLRVTVKELETASEELRQSEAKYKIIIETSNDAIYLLQEGRFIYINPKFQKFVGFTQEEVSAPDFDMLNIVAPQSRDAIIERGRRTARGEKVAPQYEFTALAKDGSEVELEASVTYIKHEGKPTVLGVLRNVTLRKNLERKVKQYTEELEKLVKERTVELLQSEAKYRNLIYSSTDSIIIADRWGKITGWNKGAQNIYGYELGEAIGKEFPAFINRGGLIRNLNELTDLINKGGGTFTEEILRETKSSAKKYLLSTYTLVKDDNGKTIAVSCIEKDITIRRELEEKLQDYAKNLEKKVEERSRELTKSEERFRGLFERVKDTVFTSTADGHFASINPTGLELFGYDSMEEISKVNISKDIYVRGEDREKYKAKIERDGFLKDMELNLKRKDGSLITVLETSLAIYNDKGEVVGYEGLIRDVTAMKDAEKRLMDANRELKKQIDKTEKAIEKLKEAQQQLIQSEKLAAFGTMAQGIAHNLNNPLSGILGRAQLMKMKFKDDKGLHDIILQAEKMSGIIDNMLYKSRQEQQVNLQELDLNRLLSIELQFLEADLNFKHNVAKVYDFADNLPKIKAIYSDFSQSLMNIIKNAIDAMHNSDKKILFVKTRYDNENIYIEIEDTGCGIKQEYLSKLFDPFFTTKPLLGEGKEDEPTGTGLGLSSAHELLNRYNAGISVQSQESVGSTFIIQVPYEKTKKKGSQKS